MILPPAIVTPKTTRGRPPGAHTAPHGPVDERQLRGRGLPGEHVVQYEREELGGSQSFEDHQQRGPDRVRQ